MKSKTLRASMGGRTFPLRGLVSAALFLGMMVSFPACGSSQDGSKIGNKDVKGTGGGGGASSSSGGDNGIFSQEGGLVVDSGNQVIQEDAACGDSTIVASPRKVSVLLVIDESGSMTDKPAGFTVDKWSALKTALGSALTPVKNDVAFGLELFPYPADPNNPIPVACSANCCEMPAAPGINIPIEPGATAVPKILTAIDATAPGGGTPTALALKRALAYFSSGGGATLAGDRYVLLATDGGPDCNEAITCGATQCTTNLDGKCPTGAGNCCDPAFGGAEANGRCLDDGATKAEVDALRGAGVKTFVVGIPGTEAYQASLDGFAVAGGQVNPAAPPKYFAVSASGGAAGLAQVLGSITQNLVRSCELQLTSDPPDLDRLNVRVDGQLIPRGADGWTLDTTTSPPTVVLQGSTCATVKAEGAERVKVIYACKKMIF